MNTKTYFVCFKWDDEISCTNIATGTEESVRERYEGKGYKVIAITEAKHDSEIEAYKRRGMPVVDCTPAIEEDPAAADTSDYEDGEQVPEKDPSEEIARAMEYKAERTVAAADGILHELWSLRAAIDGRIEAIEALMEGAEAHDIDSVGRIQYEAKWAEVAIRQAYRGVNEAHANLRGNLETWGTLAAVSNRISAS